jgi:hypothetical protein
VRSLNFSMKSVPSTSSTAASTFRSMVAKSIGSSAQSNQSSDF